MPNKIACAFGLHPDTLEMLEHDEDLDHTGLCASCKGWAFQYAALQAELEESRKDTEQYRNEVEDLLLTYSISRH